jgi:hypothetical protein
MGLRALFAADKEYRERQAAIAKKRRQATMDRQMMRRQQIREADQAYGKIDRYVLGKSGAELHSRAVKGVVVSRKEYSYLPDELKLKYLLKRYPAGEGLDDPNFIEYFEMMEEEYQLRYLKTSEKRAIKDIQEQEDLKEIASSMGLVDVLFRNKSPRQILNARRKLERMERDKDSYFEDEREIAEAEAHRSIPWWRAGADADALVRQSVREEKKLYRQENRRKRSRDSFNDDSTFLED